MTPREAQKAAIREELAKCRTDPARFNETILGRDEGDKHGNRGYWSGQRAICRSVVEVSATYAQTCNMAGKSYVDAGLIHWFLLTHPHSLVIATAPSQVQLEEVLWKEVERAYTGARIPLGGRLLRSPLKVDFGGGWQALAYSTTKVERFSGHHEADVFAVLDEASGVAEPIWEAIDSLNPSRFLATGNPLRPSGSFYERCTRAPENPHARLIQIGALDGPHIHLERSPWGLADASWLAKARFDYGEGSIWWLCHVLGLFPNSATDQLIPGEWLDLAGRTIHLRAGPTRMGIDLSAGNGGDASAICVRDDNGILDLDSSNRWDLAAVASRAAILADKHRVAGSRTTYDKNGLGFDFANRLEAAGIYGAKGYLGSLAGALNHANLRTTCGWLARQRLDPGKGTAPASRGQLVIPQTPFAIPPHLLVKLRPQLVAVAWELTDKGGVALQSKAETKLLTKRSPDEADAFFMTFAYPHA